MCAPPQPPGAPPESYVPRTDAGARKLIEKLELLEKRLAHRLDAIEEEQPQVLEKLEKVEKEMEQIHKELTDRPKEVRVFAILGGCALVVLLFVTNLNDRSSSATEKVVNARLDATEAKVLGALQQAKVTLQEENRETYNVMPARKKRSAMLEQPPAKADGGTPEDE